MLIIAISHGNYGGEPFSFSASGNPKSLSTKDVVEFICAANEQGHMIVLHIEEILIVENDSVVKVITNGELHETPNICGAW